MRRVLLLGLATLLISGCGTSAGGPGGGPTLSGNDRVEIFTAVLRRYLTTPGESSFSGSFAHVYVLNRTDGRAGEPLGTPRGAGTVIPAADQRAIAEALADLGEVTFVGNEDDVLETIDGCAQVRGGGILMTLGDPVGEASPVEVGLTGFVACLGATWLTYVIVRDASGWRVTGTTGPIAVA
jgi:hypothetical protein